MARITPIPYYKLVKVFQKAGFRVSRIKGDHVVMVKEGLYRPLVIPTRREVPVFVIKNNLRVSGLSRQEYLKLLQEI